jgi:ATP-dependent helicase/DNAse subunit B
MSTVVIETLEDSVDSSPKEEPIKLSATRLKTYLVCPRQFRYRYIDEVPTVLTGALAFGKTIHQVIHDLHQWSIYSGEPLNEHIALSDFARLWEQVITEQKPHLNDVSEIATYARLAELILMGLSQPPWVYQSQVERLQVV